MDHSAIEYVIPGWQKWSEHLFASLVAQTVKHLPTMRETRVRSLGWKDPLEKEMATHSSIHAWKIPWTEEPGGLQSMGSQRTGHNWATSLHLMLTARSLIRLFSYLARFRERSEKSFVLFLFYRKGQRKSLGKKCFEQAKNSRHDWTL